MGALFVIEHEPRVTSTANIADNLRSTRTGRSCTMAHNTPAAHFVRRIRQHGHLVLKRCPPQCRLLAAMRQRIRIKGEKRWT
jgi:hypothetical protein